MKKVLLLLVAFALTMAASGQRLTMNPRQSGQQVKSKYEFKSTHKSVSRDGQLSTAQSHRAPARVSVITEQPEGELKTYMRTGGAMYSFWGYLFTTYQDGGAMQMVFADDGKTVYLKDPISQAAANSWVKAELSDDGKTLTMPLNQYVIFYNEVDYGLITAWVDVTVDESGNLNAVPNLDIHEVTFTIGDDGTISLNGSSGDVDNFTGSGLGLIYDDDLTWAAYLDWESVYTPFDGTPVELPDGIEMEDFSMSYVDSYGNASGKMVKVGMMNNDVYVQGFSSLVTDGVMKGSMNKGDDMVLFPSDQYIGIGNSLFLNMASLDADNNLLDNLAFDYDAETRTMTANDILAVISGLNIQELYDQPVIAPYFDHAATPANPEVIDFVDQGELGGYNYGSFNVPTVDTEGNFINPNDLYYRIYFDDDELFTFGPDEYPELTEFMTDVPYSFTDGYDFGVGGATIYFYETGFQRVGIQSVFRGGGEEHVSDIVYMELKDGSAPEGSADHYAGYCDDNASQTGISAGRAQAYDVATFINDPSLKGMKVKGLRITTPKRTAVTEYTGWLSTGLNLKLVDGVKVADADITSKTTDVVTGHTDIMFDEPYEVGEDGFFAGFSIPVTDEDKPLMITSDKLGGGLWIHTSSALRSWTDMSGSGSPCIELILEGQQENAATIILPANSFAKKGEPIYVTAKLYNHGTTTLTAGEYNYEINGVTYTATFTNYIKGDHWGRSSDMIIELPAIDESGDYPLTVTVTKANDTDNQDVAPTHEGIVTIMDFVPVHRVLVEEYTGTWCGWCTRGLVAMRMLAEAYGDDFIGVAYHNSDPMAIMEDYPSPVQGFPSAFVERYYDVDPYYGYESAGFGIKDLVDYLMSQLAVVDLNVKADWADESKTEIKANVESNFVMNTDNHQYGIEVMLVEDDMYGPAGTDWDQHNYYADMDDEYASEPNLGPLCELPDVIEGYHFNDVLVATSGVVEESLPTSIVANTTNNFEYSFDVDYIYNLSYEPLIQDKDKLHVVAIVVDKATGKVLNAAKAKVGTSAVTEINVDNKEIASTIYFDLTGRKVNNPETGIYIKVVRYTDGSQRSFKVLKK
ncbi:MAG: Omp28-related outer membrane protein [Muribaculaceae bacterium]|nr:Omp28-related outer membrane protein [Muribaculaceae bacterium]